MGQSDVGSASGRWMAGMVAVMGGAVVVVEGMRAVAVVWMVEVAVKGVAVMAVVVMVAVVTRHRRSQPPAPRGEIIRRLTRRRIGPPR